MDELGSRPVIERAGVGNFRPKRKKWSGFDRLRRPERCHLPNGRGKWSWWIGGMYLRSYCGRRRNDRSVVVPRKPGMVSKIACSSLRLTSRIALYGPVCRVVWEGRSVMGIPIPIGHYHSLPALFRHRCALDHKAQFASALTGYHFAFCVSPLRHSSLRDLLADTAVSYLVG